MEISRGIVCVVYFILAALGNGISVSLIVQRANGDLRLSNNTKISPEWVRLREASWNSRPKLFGFFVVERFDFELNLSSRLNNDTTLCRITVTSLFLRAC
jgi:hypothetical protein